MRTSTLTQHRQRSAVAVLLTIVGLTLLLPAPPASAATTGGGTGHAYGSVAWAQHRLVARGYLRGVVDGVAGQRTRAAVLAYEKTFDLPRDGQLDDRVVRHLASGGRPELVGSAADRVEVDLDRQVVHVVLHGRRVATLNASSGNGAAYVSSSGAPAHADTPVGRYRVQRRISGVRRAALGTLYDPLYFHGGYAIHGSNSVPATEASHGCVRVQRWDATLLQRRVPVGTRVLLHGGRYTFRP